MYVFLYVCVYNIYLVLLKSFSMCLTWHEYKQSQQDGAGDVDQEEQSVQHSSYEQPVADVRAVSLTIRGGWEHFLHTNTLTLACQSCAWWNKKVYYYHYGIFILLNILKY